MSVNGENRAHRSAEKGSVINSTKKTPRIRQEEREEEKRSPGVNRLSFETTKRAYPKAKASVAVVYVLSKRC